MIDGVAEHELIEQRGRGTCGEASNEARARSLEGRSDGRKTSLVGPKGNGGCGLPGIVNIAERGANFFVEVVVPPDQLFAPIGGLSRRCRVEAWVSSTIGHTRRGIGTGGLGNQVQERLCGGLVRDKGGKP